MMRGSAFFRRWTWVPVLLLLLAGSGCRHDTFYQPPYTDRFYVPRQDPLGFGSVEAPDFQIEGPVSLTNAQESEERVLIGAYTHKWWANLHLWTEQALGVAKKEIDKRTSSKKAAAPKVLKVSIEKAEIAWNFRWIACALTLSVQAGNGYSTTCAVTHESMDLYESCDGALARAVACMLNDPGVRAYLAPLSTSRVPDSDCDGVPDDRDACPDTPRGVKVDERGCPLDSDGDGVPDTRDACPGTPKGAKVDERGCWVIADTLFDFDKSVIRVDAYPVLDEVVAVIKANQGVKVEIQGHTDNVGGAAYNQGLSERRAHAVMLYLVDRGIAKQTLTAVGFGLTRPKATNDTEVGRALNRRVELHPRH